jgi:hypothetical protein
MLLVRRLGGFEKFEGRWGDGETRRREDKENGRLGDGETGRQGDGETKGLKGLKV